MRRAFFVPAYLTCWGVCGFRECRGGDRDGFLTPESLLRHGGAADREISEKLGKNGNDHIVSYRYRNHKN